MDTIRLPREPTPHTHAGRQAGMVRPLEKVVAAKEAGIDPGVKRFLSDTSVSS